MAKSTSVCRYFAGAALAAWATSSAATDVAPRLSSPRAARLTAADIGLVINTADPYSEAIGRYYAEKRHLAPAQVLKLDLPLRSTLEPEEFERLREQIQSHFGPQIQALALAWTQPYAVQCNSITGALALGYDAGLCRQTCSPSTPSRYFDAATAKPFSDLHLRPSMLLAAASVAEGKALINRGVAADHSLGLRGAPPVYAYFVSTPDKARNVRARLFPAPGLLRRYDVDVKVEQGDSLRDKHGLLLYETGLARVEHLQTLQWVNGALADHLTSFGGQLDHQNGQMTALAWIASGATASYGTVSEPCNHPQKFPHPQVLLQHYLQGSTAIEAYWKSVAWPQQGLFIGEPLAAPFAR